MTLRSVFRLDVGKMGNVRETPQGGIRVPASLTRVGIFEYKRDDGTTQRELRRPEQVFDPRHLETIAGATVTDLHPKGLVTADTFQSVSRGHVADSSVKQDDKFVTAELVIQDAAVVKAVKGKTRSEISLGYTCDIDPTPGEYNGEKYDCEQVNIRCNHVALGPSGWGRAGSDVRLRLDSAGSCLPLDNDVAPVIPSPKKRQDNRPMNKLLPLLAIAFSTDFTSARMDSVEYRLDTAEGRTQAFNALQAGQARQRDALAAVRTDLDPEKAKGLVDELLASFAQMQTQLMALAVAVTDASADEPDGDESDAAMPDAATLDALLEKRTTLKTRAAALAPALAVKDAKSGVTKMDGLDERAIMVAALAERKIIVKEDSSDDYVRGLFEAIPLPVVNRQDNSLGFIRAIGSGTMPIERKDGDNAPAPKTAEEIRADSQRKSSQAWRKPLEASSEAFRPVGR